VQKTTRKATDTADNSLHFFGGGFFDPQGYNWITQDELQNTYDASKEGACNFKP
jgi:hypothetical protein